MQDMAAKLAKLLERVQSATGADRSLDSALAECLGVVPGAKDSPPEYTASTDLCIALVERAMPGWHWHIGFGPKGILPYATLSTGESRYESLAGTVPLALLSALIQARAATVESAGPPE